VLEWFFEQHKIKFTSPGDFFYALGIILTFLFIGIFKAFKESKPKNSDQVQESDISSDENHKTDTTDVMLHIEKLTELHDAGILTDEEFQSKKAELLKKL